MKEINQLPVEKREALLEASWRSLYERVLRDVRRWTSNEAEAEDIVQGAVVLFLQHPLASEIENVERSLLLNATKLLRDMQSRQKESVPLNPETEVSAWDCPRFDQADRFFTNRRRTLSQRLYGVLKFDRDPPNDDEVKDMISNYLTRKYS